MDARWTGLHRTGGIAALAAAMLTLLGIITFILWPPPVGSPVTTWFELFRKNPFAGMMDLDLVMLLVNITLIPIFVALYIALRHGHESLTTLAIALGLVAVTCYIASSPIFEILTLSRQYAGATSDAERQTLIAAGHAVLTSYLGSSMAPARPGAWTTQGTAFNVGYLLSSIAGTMFSFAMLRRRTFGAWIAYAGIIGNLAGLGLFLPTIGIALSMVALLLILVWLFGVGFGLLRLAREGDAGITAPDAS